MDIADHLRVLRRRWLLVVSAPVVAFLVALAVTMPSVASAEQHTTTYAATHRLLRQNSAAASMPLGTVALVAQSGDVPQKVIDTLGGGEEIGRVVAGTALEADNELWLLSVTATAQDPAMAERVADTYAEQVLVFLRDDASAGQSAAEVLARQNRRLEELDASLAQQPIAPAAASLRTERDKLLQQIGRTQERQSTTGAAGGVALRTLQPAVAVPVAPEGFQPPTAPGPRLLIATLMGLLIGVVSAFALDRADTTVRSRRDAEVAFGVPVIAEIPKLSRRVVRNRQLVTTTRPASLAAEAYRALRLGVQVMPRWLLRRSVEPGSLGELVTDRLDVEVDHGRGRVVLVSSPGAAEGKTTTVANLAASFAEIGSRVLVLDCDFRSPQLTHTMQAEPGAGVAEYLRQEGGAQQLVDLARPSFVPNVWVVPAGEAVGNPGELLRPNTDLVAAAATLADVVVIDVGPLLAVNEGATLAPLVDAVVLIARAGQTTVESARRASELVARVEAPVAGSVLVGASGADVGSRYYDGHYGRTQASTARKPQTFPDQPQVVR